MTIYDVCNLPGRLLIGHDGENDWRPQPFDFSKWADQHPGGAFSVFIRPAGHDVFPVTVVVDGTIAVWTPVDSELIEGIGKLQCAYQAGDHRVLSDVISYVVDGSILGDGEHPEEREPPWALQVTASVAADAARAEAAAERAEQAAGDIDEDAIAEAVAAYLDEHPASVTVDSTLSSTSENPVQNKVINAALNQKGTYSKPSGGIPASDLANGVIPTVSVTGVSVNGTELTPQDGVVDVQVPTDYVNTGDFGDRTDPFPVVLSYSNGVVAIERSGTPLDRLIPAILNNCNHWFLLPTAYITGIQSITDMMRFWMTGANMDTSAPTVSLTSEYGGKVYHAVLSPVSEYRMEGQLQILDYQTASDVQSAIAAAAELPSGGSTGDFLRKTASGAAWQTVPSAESNSFGGGA